MELFEAKLKQTVVDQNGRQRQATTLALIDNCDTYSEAEVACHEIFQDYKFNQPVIDVIKKVKLSLRAQINFGYDFHYMVSSETLGVDDKVLKDALVVPGGNPGEASEIAAAAANPDDVDAVEIKKVIEYPISFYSFRDPELNDGKRLITSNEIKVEDEPVEDREVF